jgi:uncharacterized membrane protein YeaQ/YmgE (transglycosylase-associated protein family)
LRSKPESRHARWYESMDGIIIFLLVGLAAGFLAGKLMGAESHGIVANLIIGVIGAIIGGLSVVSARDRHS